ncbi:MAG: Ig-like domain repeat protein [Nitrospirae bacterium]|nr:Ig-like domain repeat protein [Nitrospirota bacterium]
MKLKKLLNLKKRNRREPRANDFTVESLEPRLLLSATPMTAAVVTTDHQDYAPRETAVITTSNQAGDGLQFSAGEMVSFQVTRTDGMADYSGSTTGVGPAGNEAWYVVDGMGGFTAHLGSDVSGDGVADWIAPDNDMMVNSSISTTWYVEEQYRNSTLLVTAAGQESGAMATHAFTDANVNTSTVVTASSATSTYGDDVTFTATVTPSAGGTTNPIGTVEFFDALNNSLGATSSATPGSGLSSVFSVTLSAATLTQLAAGSYSIHAVFTGGDNGTDSFNDSPSVAVDHTVNQKNITGSFGAESRAYDGTTAAFVLFTDLDLSGVVGLDEVALGGGIATFNDADADFNKTVTLIGATLFGADAGNYNLTSVATALADIDKAAASVTVNGFIGAFDNQPHGATGTAIGVLGEDLSGLLDLGPSFTAIGTHVADWTFSGNNNYDPQFGTVDIVINEVTVNTTTSISASTNATTYGDQVTLTATVTALVPDAGAPIGTVEFFDGVGNSLGFGNFDGSLGLDSTFTLNIATLTAGLHNQIHAVFTAPATFFGSTSGSTIVDVSKATVTVTGFNGTYDGLAHGATVVGVVLGEDLSAGLVSDTFTNVPGGTANWNYTDLTGNYENASSAIAGTVEIVINKADVTPVDYIGVYDGAAHGATLVGVLGEILMTGPLHTNAGLFTDTINFIGGAGNYNDFSGDVITSISALEITGSFTANNKVYDGTTDATAQNTSLLGVIGLDDVTLDGGIATFDDANAGINKTVTLTGATLGGAAAGNYVLSPAAITDQASITALAITGSFTANNKVYDGTTAASVASTSLTGVLIGDLGLVDLSGGTATLADKNVGAGKTVTLTGATLTGVAAGKGDFTAANKVYDGNAVAFVVTRTLTGAILGDDVSLTGGTAAFDDANAGIGKTVTLTGAALTGADQGNYTLSLSPITTTANIVALGITGSFTADHKVYDGTTSASVASTSLTGVLAGDVGLVSLTGGTASFDDVLIVGDGKNVGTGKTVTLTGATLGGVASGNYSLLSVATTTADITALDITGSFAADSKVYDGTTLAAVSGTSLAGTIVGDDVILTFDQADFDTKDVGIDKTVTLLNAALFGTDAGNYNLTLVANALADITALQLDFSFTVDDKVYDGNTTATGLIGNLTGFIGTDDVDWDFGTVAFNSVIAGPTKLVNLTGLILIGVDAGNYSLASSFVQSTAAITQKQLTVTFTVNDKAYDGNTSVTGLVTTVDGVIAPDNVTLAFTSVAFNSSIVGPAKLVNMTGATLIGTEATNYSLASSTITSTAAITAKQLTASFAVNNKVYDGNTATTGLVMTLNGVIAPDNVSLTGGVATFDDANAGNGKTVTLTGLGITGTEATNYSLLSSTATSTANITKANATITVSGYTGVYDATAHGATGSATGIGGVNLNAGLNLGASFTNAPGGTANWSFSGGTNYNDANGSVAIVINKANATLVLTGYYGTYDGAAHQATGTATGVLGESLDARPDRVLRDLRRGGAPGDGDGDGRVGREPGRPEHERHVPHQRGDVYRHGHLYGRDGQLQRYD